MTEAEQVCFTCKESWPLDEEFFYRRPEDKNKFKGQCIACYLEHQAKRRASKVWNKEERRYV